MYNGTTEAYAYAGIMGTGADNMYRADLSAFGVWTNMALPGGPLPVANFDLVKVPGTAGDPLTKEVILYVLDGTGANANIYATYSPELVSGTVPLWRFDAAAPVLWQALGGAARWGMAGPTPGGTNMPCPFDAVVGASVTLLARDNAPVLGVDSIPNITETTAFLTPIGNYSPAEGATVASNNTATGEPVELQWAPVPGATSYDVMTVTDSGNPATILPGASTVGAAGLLATPIGTAVSIPVGSLVDGQAYFWRTRVASTTGGGDHTGPWSAWNTYTVEYGAGEVHQAPELVSPAPGASGVALTPGFSWKAIPDATGYDFQLATDGAFTDVLADEAGLPGSQTSASYSGTLERETSYFWRVRAMGGTGIDAWTTPWSSAAFSTMEEPEPQPTFPPPVTVQEGDTVIIEQVDRDTPGWVWALIVIGAVLAIVVIVLIMRTRRPV
jgi:hypothetical protein